jgi:5-methylcytosine-specific restriction endonuclease McrA
MAQTLFNSIENAYHGIINKYTKGCIMKRVYKNRCDIIDILGQKFHDLTVTAFAGRGKYRGSIWECTCVCGKKCLVPGGHLRANMRKSCGCRSEARIDQTGINIIYSSYKRKALLRKKVFDLDIKTFEELIKGKCHYCGIDRSQTLKRQKSRKLQILYNGIDRVDSKIGYTKENCVPCCKYCNQSKSDLTLSEWKDHLNRLFSYQGITNGDR